MKTLTATEVGMVGALLCILGPGLVRCADLTEYPAVVVEGITRDAIVALISNRMTDREYKLVSSEPSIITFTMSGTGLDFGEQSLLLSALLEGRKSIQFVVEEQANGLKVIVQITLTNPPDAKPTVIPFPVMKEEMRFAYERITDFLKELKHEAETGCRPDSDYEVEQTEDKFDGYTIARMKEMRIETHHDVRPIFISAQRYRKQGKTSYSLIIEYCGDDWLFIGRGESLVLLVDGKRIGLSGAGSANHREVITGGGVSETAFYEISISLLRQLAKGKQVEFKLIGRTAYVVHELDSCHLKNLGRFADEFGDEKTGGKTGKRER